MKKNFSPTRIRIKRSIISEIVIAQKTISYASNDPKRLQKLVWKYLLKTLGWVYLLGYLC